MWGMVGFQCHCSIWLKLTHQIVICPKKIGKNLKSQSPSEPALHSANIQLVQKYRFYPARRTHSSKYMNVFVS